MTALTLPKSVHPESSGRADRPPLRCSECENQACRDLFGARPTDDRQGFSALRIARQMADARSTLQLEGDEIERIAVLYSGWAYLYRTLPDGRRHVIDFLLPGDVVPSVIDAEIAIPFGAETASAASLCVFTRDDIMKARHRDATLDGRLSKLQASFYARAIERQTTMALLSAEERVCYRLLSVYQRARRRGLVDGNSCPFPISQALLAESCGLALGNVNRILASIREGGLAKVSHKTLTVLDEGRLAHQAAAYDAA